MLYLILKALHVLSAVIFLGTGLGSAWFKWRADRTGDARVASWAARQIVIADWVFTVPAGLLLPVTGLWMAAIGGMDFGAGWILWGLGGYAVAGVLWLPAAWLQLRMRDLAARASRDGEPLPAEFHRYARAWAALGVPSFGAATVTVWVMIAKHGSWAWLG